jgi:hypothetical protein
MVVCAGAERAERGGQEKRGVACEKREKQYTGLGSWPLEHPVKHTLSPIDAHHRPDRPVVA